MTEAQDDEVGDDYWQWIQDNHEEAKNDSINLLNTFFVFDRINPTKVLATRSLVSDDRNMNKTLGLKEAVWFGGFNVHRDERARGLGTILFEYTDNHIQQMINKEITVRLFSVNPISKHLYSKFGFESQGFVNVDPVGNQPVRSTF
ncbi:unnamed protein product [Adineta steineri]|uniref:N-acetyltransferase domain-containing protein n=1 Tax=Adineta steineri TaxID=433720 RepID=A0A814V4E6_9BILA|nr:unnamed protein product [Adineta steineri]CAF1186155.1 unnamed protein product [Adineta steineri]